MMSVPNIAVIKADIIGSRKLTDQSVWIEPLRCLLSQWGPETKSWDILWGDTIQLELDHPSYVVKRAIQIKALIKSITQSSEKARLKNEMDIRIAIGIGRKSFDAGKVRQNNGPAYIQSAECLQNLVNEDQRMGILTPWRVVNEEADVLFRFANILMDDWTIASAELVSAVCNSKNLTQKELGRHLGIAQNTVSVRWHRSHLDVILRWEQRMANLIRTYDSITTSTPTGSHRN